MSNNGLFFFSNSAINQFFDDKYAFKFSEQIQVSDIREILMYQLGFISDYYADIAENEAKEIKKLAASVTLTNNFSEGVTDLLTLLTFNNLRLKESLIATIRVFSVFKKHSTEEGIGTKERIDAELNDLAVVSDYIQFNFERLDNLSNHVTNKINLEQNHIVKILTVVTLCISLPTFIAGIYGMNFKDIPELELPHGYPIIIGVMIVSAILPYLFFKRKKWL
jgi:magnesium transporter